MGNAVAAPHHAEITGLADDLVNEFLTAYDASCRVVHAAAYCPGALLVPPPRGDRSDAFSAYKLFDGLIPPPPSSLPPTLVESASRRLRASIVCSEQLELTPGSPHVDYLIIASFGDIFALSSFRYQQFRAFHTSAGSSNGPAKNIVASAELPPPSSAFGNRDLSTEFAEARVTHISAWLDAITTAFNVALATRPPDAATIAFLGLSPPTGKEPWAAHGSGSLARSYVPYVSRSDAHVAARRPADDATLRGWATHEALRRMYRHFTHLHSAHGTYTALRRGVPFGGVPTVAAYPPLTFAAGTRAPSWRCVPAAVSDVPAVSAALAACGAAADVLNSSSATPASPSRASLPPPSDPAAGPASPLASAVAAGADASVVPSDAAAAAALGEGDGDASPVARPPFPGTSARASLQASASAASPTAVAMATALGAQSSLASILPTTPPARPTAAYSGHAVVPSPPARDNAPPFGVAWSTVAVPQIGSSPPEVSLIKSLILAEVTHRSAHLATNAPPGGQATGGGIAGGVQTTPEAYVSDSRERAVRALRDALASRVSHMDTMDSAMTTAYARARDAAARLAGAAAADAASAATTGGATTPDAAGDSNDSVSDAANPATLPSSPALGSPCARAPPRHAAIAACLWPWGVVGTTATAAQQADSAALGRHIDAAAADAAPQAALSALTAHAAACTRAVVMATQEVYGAPMVRGAHTLGGAESALARLMASVRAAEEACCGAGALPLSAAAAAVLPLSQLVPMLPRPDDDPSAIGKLLNVESSSAAVAVAMCVSVAMAAVSLISTLIRPVYGDVVVAAATYAKGPAGPMRATSAALPAPATLAAPPAAPADAPPSSPTAVGVAALSAAPAPSAAAAALASISTPAAVRAAALGATRHVSRSYAMPLGRANAAAEVPQVAVIAPLVQRPRSLSLAASGTLAPDVMAAMSSTVAAVGSALYALITATDVAPIAECVRLIVTSSWHVLRAATAPAGGAGGDAGAVSVAAATAEGATTVTLFPPRAALLVCTARVMRRRLLYETQSNADHFVCYRRAMII